MIFDHKKHFSKCQNEPDPVPRCPNEVNNLSMFAKLTLPLQAAYCASKHALLALQNSAAAEAAASGVRVNSVSPGFCRCPGLMVVGPLARPFFVDPTRSKLEAISGNHFWGWLVNREPCKTTCYFFWGGTWKDDPGQLCAVPAGASPPAAVFCFVLFY